MRNMILGTMCLLLAATPALAQKRPRPPSDGHGPDAGEQLTPAGPLQGNWRIVRAGDPDDGAIMAIQLIHDGDTVEGSYVLFQPFCGVELPLPRPLGEDCEFIDTGGQFDAGARVHQSWVRLTLRPGADALAHRLDVPLHGGNLRLGYYQSPNMEAPLEVVIERAVE
ncbi:MAG: hypothetical protein J0L52_03990 [Caulobacterales bacterium]|nr:hypothetical protein [Caulobacterales bacterium]